MFAFTYRVDSFIDAAIVAAILFNALAPSFRLWSPQKGTMSNE